MWSMISSAIWVFLSLFQFFCDITDMHHYMFKVQHNDLTYIDHKMITTVSSMNIIPYRYKIKELKKI